jgi:hypothetical protein
MQRDGNESLQMSNGKRSKSHHPKQTTPRHDENPKTDNAISEGVNLAPLADKVDALVKAYGAAHGDDKKNSDQNLFWHRWTALFTALAFIAAAIYAGITYQQWRDLRHNFEIDQRAWLKIGISVWPELIENGTAEASGVFINIGKSTTTGMYSESVMEIVPASQSPSFKFKGRHNTSSRTPIFPGDQDTFPIDLWDQTTKTRRPFTADEIDRIRNGQAYIAIYGVFVYSDQFGKYWERFCNWHAYAIGSFIAGDCLNWNDAADNKERPMPPLD